MKRIYALFDPSDETQTPLYVGQTKNQLAHRRAQHITYRGIRTKTGRLVQNWVANLIADGRDIGIRLLEEVSDIGADDAEVRWIEFGRQQNWPLLNQTFGGRGGRGRVDTPDVIARRTASRLATFAKKTPEEKAKTAEKISRTLSGRPLAPEHRRKIQDYHDRVKAALSVVDESRLT